MRINVIDCIAGTTLKLTWVSSGVTPSGICSSLITGSETVVSSVTGVSSGNGHYYALHNMPNSAGWFSNLWLASVGVNTYVHKQLVRSQHLEVD
jgi:hypothetical protein